MGYFTALAEVPDQIRSHLPTPLGMARHTSIVTASGAANLSQRRIGWVFQVACLLALVVSLDGCVASPIHFNPAGTCEARRTFYVVNQAWHVGIALERQDLIDIVPSLAEDFREGDYLEIGWGDAQFYQAPGLNPGLALQAILWPTPSVLHVVGFQGTPRSYFSANEVLEVSVEQTGYRLLLAYVANSFARTADNTLIRFGPGLYGESWFYGAKGKFHAFNTCNTWVAKAIEKTGYPISSTLTLTANGVLSQLRRGGDSEVQCYSVR